MTGKTPPTRSGKQSQADAREARLKAALKANMARRKAQAKARAHETESGAQPDGTEEQ